MGVIREWKQALAIILAVAALVALTGCGKDSSRSPGTPPDKLTIFYTCDTRGHIEPCTCATGYAGGLVRRMAYIDERRPAASLLVDAGNVTAGPRDWELLELQYALRGYMMMGYHAVNAGHRETSISPEKLRELDAEFGLFVSANLMDASGELVFAPYRIVDLPEKYRVGIIGVMDDNLEDGLMDEGLQVDSPDTAIAKYLSKLEAETDFVVLLAFADEPRMKTFAENFFELDVIVGGKVLQPSNIPLEVNQSVIVYNTDKGKAVGRLELTFPKSARQSYTNEIYMLEEDVPGDPSMLAIVDELNRTLADMDFRPHRDDEEGLTTITAVRSKTANKYVTSGRCKECHPRAYDVWMRSRHARSFETLVPQKGQYDPNCLNCHTVGYGSSDGYVNQRLTPDLDMVSCGSCHGRGDYHIKFRNGDDIPERAAQFKPVDCLGCHDETQSPEFNLETYWEKINHGKD